MKLRKLLSNFRKQSCSSVPLSYTFVSGPLFSWLWACNTNIYKLWHFETKSIHFSRIAVIRSFACGGEVNLPGAFSCVNFPQIYTVDQLETILTMLNLMIIWFSNPESLPKCPVCSVIQIYLRLCSLTAIFSGGRNNKLIRALLARLRMVM